MDAALLQHRFHLFKVRVQLRMCLMFRRFVLVDLQLNICRVEERSCPHDKIFRRREQVPRRNRVKGNAANAVCVALTRDVTDFEMGPIGVLFFSQVRDEIIELIEFEDGNHSSNFETGAGLKCISRSTGKPIGP